MTVEYEAFDASASPTGLALTLVPGVVAVLASAAFLPAAVVGSVGVVAMTAGVRNASRKLLTVGAVVLFGAALVAGAAEVPVPFVLVGAGAAVVAWDAGTNAVSVGTQLGAAADTRRIEVLHVLSTAGVATAVGAVGYGAFRLASGGQPTAAVALLSLAALLISYVLDT